MADPKTHLSFEEQITAVFMHFVRGWPQQDIALCMGGVNISRVNDACNAAESAFKYSGKPRPRKVRRRSALEEQVLELRQPAA